MVQVTVPALRDHLFIRMRVNLRHHAEADTEALAKDLLYDVGHAIAQPRGVRDNLTFLLGQQILHLFLGCGSHGSNVTCSMLVWRFLRTNG